MSLVPRRHLAWDCATGNGQAARDLGRYFDRVIATDGSPDQIAQAIPGAHVEYRVAPAESSGLETQSVDLVTVAQALHWFAHDTFFAEVRRVAVPKGIVAAWSYGSCHAGPDVESILRDFEEGTVGPYWNPERKWVREGYETIPFPFVKIPAPDFELRAVWTLRQLGAYLQSWSAVTKFRRERGTDPVAPLLERIASHWGPAERTRDVTWALNIRVGRVE